MQASGAIFVSSLGHTLFHTALPQPAYGYLRVAWWLRRKESLSVNRKRILRVMRERGLLVPSQ
jgi:hypothetical protein